jgi:hypothetical protein
MLQWRHRVVAVGAYTLQSTFTLRPESPEGKDVALRRRVEEMLFGLGGTKKQSGKPTRLIKLRCASLKGHGGTWVNQE